MSHKFQLVCCACALLPGRAFHCTCVHATVCSSSNATTDAHADVQQSRYPTYDTSRSLCPRPIVGGAGDSLPAQRSHSCSSAQCPAASLDAPNFGDRNWPREGSHATGFGSPSVCFSEIISSSVKVYPRSSANGRRCPRYGAYSRLVVTRALLVIRCCTLYSDGSQAKQRILARNPE